MLAAAWWNKEILWIFRVWQIPLFILLIALIFIYLHIRNRQV